MFTKRLTRVLISTALVALSLSMMPSRKSGSAGAIGFATTVEADDAAVPTNLFFLHHSTGDGFVVQGNMRGYIKKYNTKNKTTFQFWDHGYNGDGLRNPAGQSTGTSYEIPDDNTDPIGLYRLWAKNDAQARYSRDLILANHQVIAFKSCFPASCVPDTATLNQYKKWYMAIRKLVDKRKDRVFVVMSTPPLHRLSTNPVEAANARAFANWLKSSAFLGTRRNLYCFDLFDVLAAPDDGSDTANMLRYEYEASHSDGDSHPNLKANKKVAPLLSQALINAAIQYGSVVE